MVYWCSELLRSFGKTLLIVQNEPAKGHIKFIRRFSRLGSRSLCDQHPGPSGSVKAANLALHTSRFHCINETSPALVARVRHTGFPNFESASPDRFCSASSDRSSQDRCESSCSILHTPPWICADT